MAFWDHVEETKTCWLWRGNTTDGGYGRAKHGGVKWMAHRLAWTLERGPIPKGMLVLHKCDVRLCVNPGHLFLGDQKDNIADMFSKGRSNKARGERHGAAKLTNEQADELKAKYAAGGITQAKLAEKYGLHPVYVNKLLRGHKRAG